MSSDEASLAEFLDTTAANTFPNVIDGDAIWENFGIAEQRTYVYINDDGTWETSGYGSLREDVLDLIDS